MKKLTGDNWPVKEKKKAKALLEITLTVERN